jgi:hypothetical protein
VETAEQVSPFDRAYYLAKRNGLYIVSVSERVDPAQPGKYVTAYVVYRKTAEGQRGTRLGRRRDPAQLLAFVKQIIGH